ncbi:hypothetical protein [Vibrio phage vB_VpaP_SJSY21]|nr:hypothetical protein [Vibrio phage vB_VpaP_SJSY21]
MKISKNSWHYKLNSKVHGKYTIGHINNLCEYVRRLFTSLLLLLFIFVALVVLIFIAVVPIIGVFSELSGPMLSTQIIGTGCYIIMGIAGIVIGAANLFDKISCSMKSKKGKKKEPNIFVEYIKAKKSKFCPTIEFSND